MAIIFKYLRENPRIFTVKWFFITSNVRVDVKRTLPIRLPVTIENILGAYDNLGFIRLKDFPCLDMEFGREIV